MDLIDLRSDTVTRPSLGMREAIARAEVGDDVYGEDPSVNELERRVAMLLGKEAALLVTSGTMANQVAIGAQAGPGDEVIVEAGAHCVAYEAGAVAALWGVQTRMIPGTRGLLTAAQVTEAIRPGGGMDHLPVSKLLCVENTHNRGGGTVWPLAQLREVTGAARAAGLSVHLDGARLWNAHVKSGTPLPQLAACADTVSVCLSKGLGAPAGSLVAGPTDVIRRARRLRKRLGGGLRQAGVLAAAGLFALEHNLARLAEDHANALALAKALAQVPGLSVDVDVVETNMIFVEVVSGDTASQVLARCKERGVLLGSDAPRRFRIVTHLDAPAEKCAEAARRIAAAMAA